MKIKLNKFKTCYLLTIPKEVWIFFCNYTPFPGIRLIVEGFRYGNPFASGLVVS